MRKGFTLMEVLITVCIIGILAGIAIPSYQDSVRKGRRVEAMTELNAVSQTLERCYSQFYGYNTDSGCTLTSEEYDSSPSAFYKIKVTRDKTSYSVDATAQNAQSNDEKCTKFTITNKGEKKAEGSDSSHCW